MTFPLPDNLVTGNPIDADEDWNPLVRAVNTLAGLVTPTAWTTLPLNTPWQPFGGAYPTLQHAVVGDAVRLRGVIRASAAAPVNSTITTLPAQARPVAQHALWLTVNATTSLRVDVLPTGELRILAAIAAATTLLFDNTHIWLS